MPDREFGEIPGVAPGTTFPDRRALAQAGVHRPLQAGIAGSGLSGAESIVVSGGYEDDVDDGNEIIYTGHGGNDRNIGRQVADQTLTRGNLALARNRVAGLPVRVVRGAGPHSPLAPARGYRYDGLYSVVDHWCEKGRSGYLIWRFKLVRNVDQPRLSGPEPVAALAPAERKATTMLRIIRNTAVTTRV